MTLRFVRILPIFALIAALGSACGSRGPLDDADPTGDGQTVDAGSTPDGNNDIIAIPPPDASLIKPDATPISPGFDSGIPIVNCGLCLAQSCSTKFVQCFQDTQCSAVVQCVLQTCLAGQGGAGGGLNTQCLLDCGKGNLGGAIAAAGVLECVTSNCGTSCLSALGGSIPGL